MSTTAEPPRKPRRKHPKRPYRPGQSVLSAEVPQGLNAEVHRLAAEKGVSVSAVIREGIGLVMTGTAGGMNVAAPPNGNDNNPKGDGVK